MSHRQLRVNKLIRHEVSMILRTYFQSEAVLITVTRVEIAPDLRAGRIFFSVLGDNQKYRVAGQFLAKNRTLIRRLMGKNVRLKYLPHLEFIPDHSIEEAMHTIELIDNLQPEEDLGEVIDPLHNAPAEPLPNL